MVVAAERTGVTIITIRNTMARDERTGRIAKGGTVAATPMARERVGRMASAMILRWELALEVMLLLVREPELAGGSTRPARPRGRPGEAPSVTKKSAAASVACCAPRRAR